MLFMSYKFIFVIVGYNNILEESLLEILCPGL